MASLILTQVYLEPRQKAALRKIARAKGTKVAEEVRDAVDVYLTGVTAEELALLDAATKETKRHIDAMATELDRVNARLDATFADLEKIRAESPLARAQPLA